MKKVFRNIHLWLSIPIGLIVVAICFSGAMLVFEKEVNNVALSDLYEVDGSKGKPIPMGELMDKVAETLPDSVSITGVVVAPDPNKAYQVNLSKPARASVWVDQYTGEIKGNNRRLAFFDKMFKLHRWLLTSRPSDDGIWWGKRIVGVCTILLVIVLIAGLIIWFPRNRAGWKNAFAIPVRKGGFRFLFGLHNAGGIYSLIFLLAIALTGLTWSFDWYKQGFYKMFGVEAPSYSHGGDGRRGEHGGKPEFAHGGRFGEGGPRGQRPDHANFEGEGGPRGQRPDHANFEGDGGPRGQRPDHANFEGDGGPRGQRPDHANFEGADSLHREHHRHGNVEGVDSLRGKHHEHGNNESEVAAINESHTHNAGPKDAYRTEHHRHADKEANGIADGRNPQSEGDAPMPEAFDEISEFAQWQHIYDRVSSENPGKTITVSEGKASIALDGFGNVRASDIYNFNNENGEIYSVDKYRNQSRSDKIRGWIYSIHVGAWGGILTRILTFLAVLIGASLPITGYYLWIRRLMKKSHKS
jgi:uncharacterized iron-regulated membrane protein